jgi:hypothetical protein
MKSRKRKRVRRRLQPKRRNWATLPKAKLLDVRCCDLNLRIAGTALAARERRLYDELEHRGLNFRPHVWLSDDWFTPADVPGIAIPFYLAHPRLMSLERSMMLEVEGGSERMFMRILRHEAGHAIDNAFRLHHRREWRKVFGKASLPYPEHYQPRPYSKSYVLHLDMWYAQAHPLEDFAETFAVWLTPGARWRQRYAGWPAFRKLEYVDALMREIAGQRRRVHSTAKVDQLHSNRTTLRDHYRSKMIRYGEEWPDFYDRDLRRIFSDDPQFRANPTAATFMRRLRPHLRRTVSRWTGAYQYTIDQVLLDIIDRCRELKLRVAVSPRQASLDALMMLTVQTMNYLHAGHHRVAL